MTRVELTITTPTSTQTVSTVEEDDSLVILALWRAFGMALAARPSEAEVLHNRMEALADLAQKLGIWQAAGGN